MAESLQEFIENVTEYYQTKVKPYLHKETIPKARTAMTNLFLEIKANSDKFKQYKSSLNFYLMCGELLDELKEDNIPSGEILRNLEAYMAQLKLAIASDNTFESVLGIEWPKMNENYQTTYEQALKDLYVELCGPLRNKMSGLLNFVEMCNHEHFRGELSSRLQESAANAKVCMDGLRETSENMGKILKRLPEEKLAEFNQYMLEKTKEDSK